MTLQLWGVLEGGQEGEYRSLVEDFVKWYRSNILQLNTSKTKEMVVDFQRQRPTLPPVSTEGVDVEVVRTYKYLGVQLDDTHTLVSKHRCTLQEGAEPALFPEKAGVL